MRLVANYAGEDYNIHGEKCEEQVEQCEIIGERERANLVVQLARFFYIYISLRALPFQINATCT